MSRRGSESHINYRDQIYAGSGVVPEKSKQSPEARVNRVRPFKTEAKKNEDPDYNFSNPKIFEGQIGTAVFATERKTPPAEKPHRLNADAIAFNSSVGRFRVIDGMGGEGENGIGDLEPDHSAAWIAQATAEEGFAANWSAEKIDDETAKRIQAICPGAGSLYVEGQIDIENRVLIPSQRGDARMLVISKDGIIKFRTIDEEVTELDVAKGRAKKESLGKVRNAIMSPGQDSTTRYDPVPLENGDTIIACSDVIADNLGNARLAEYCTGREPKEALEIIYKILKQNMQARGEDDRTLLIIAINNLPEAKETNPAELIGQCKDLGELLVVIKRLGAISSHKSGGIGLKVYNFQQLTQSLLEIQLAGLKAMKTEQMALIQALPKEYGFQAKVIELIGPRS